MNQSELVANTCLPAPSAGKRRLKQVTIDLPLLLIGC